MSDIQKNILSRWMVFLFIFVCVLFVLSAAFSIYLLLREDKFTTHTLKSGEMIIGIEFTESERKMMLNDVKSNRSDYEKNREIDISNDTAPPLLFNPFVPGMQYDFKDGQPKFSFPDVSKFEVPDNLEELAFYPVTFLSQLIKNRKITSVQLTEMYLDRLKKYGPKLECVVTLTEELALEQARKADEEIATGYYRGPLHGIPWGAKDLLAAEGIKTTWGAMPYKDQITEKNATVVKKLQEAGAVLVAKLTMGALAMGDVWFGGKTKNPWDLEQGSSGSSAGSAAATSAGLVGFAIGTETWGSILSPATRCGVTGLRPTFGRVSRYGAMALSWSMDKIGPICRTVDDCALVFNVIRGPDNQDLSVVDLPFNWDPDLDIKKLRIGYLEKEFEGDYKRREYDQAVLNKIKELGIELIPLELPDLPVSSLSFILNAEAAAAFDELTRSNKDDLLVRQTRGSWPNIFRQSRFIPAVEYIQANRIRSLLMASMAEKLKEIDVYIAPYGRGDNLLLTNLTGHPAVVVPNGFDEKGRPVSITFIGKLYKENEVLAVARAYQEATDFHQKHPDLE